MGAAFMVSYTRAKSESLGFTPGTGMANVGLAPREVRIVILSVGLVAGRRCCRAPADTGHAAPRRIARGRAPSSPLGLIAILATLTVIQRILSRPPTNHDTANQDVKPQHGKQRSTNGKQRPNGARPTAGPAPAAASDGKIRVAIVGVGNCASSLVQGRYYYENAKEDDFVPA